MMKRARFVKYLPRFIYLHIGLMILASTGNIWFGADFYFRVVALAWCVLPISILWLIREESRLYPPVLLWSLFAFNNLLDELIFNPNKIQINEYVFALTVIIYVMYKATKKTMEKIAHEIIDFFKKAGFDILLIMGFTGAISRTMIEGNTKHTLGQKFVIVLMGGIVSYIVGGIAKSLGITPQWLSFVGFMCGMFGYSIMKYIIGNEKAMFHSLAIMLSGTINTALTRLVSWVPKKKEKDEEQITDTPSTPVV